MDSSGTIYVADYYNNTIRKITSDRVCDNLRGFSWIRRGS